MIQAWKQFFGFFANLFSAASRGANTIDLYAKDMEAEATFACELKQLDRNARIKEHKARLEAVESESKLKAVA